MHYKRTISLLRMVVQAKVTKLLTGLGKKALSPKEFREFELQDRWSESHNADVFRFKLPHSDDSMGLTVASCIVVGADIEQKGETKFVVGFNVAVDR